LPQFESSSLFSLHGKDLNQKSVFLNAPSLEVVLDTGQQEWSVVELVKFVVREADLSFEAVSDKEHPLGY
jgi:hypothetical protein